MTEIFAQVLIDHAPIAAFVVDSKWRLRHVNPKASPVFSRIDNLLERDFRDVLRILWPAPTADWVLEKFEHTTETGEPYFNPEFSEVRADLKERQYYDWQLHRITLPDGENALVCYFSDISKHVQDRQALEDSERLFHQLFDLMPQLGWTAQPNGFVDFYNRGWYEYTGKTFEQMHAGSTREQMLGWGQEAVHDPEIWPSLTSSAP
jgi:PAS domain-containing protein